MQRVIHPAQRTSRGSLDSSLWETVPQVQHPLPEPIPVPEVSDSDWGAFDEAQGGDDATVPAVGSRLEPPVRPQREGTR